MPSDCRRRWLRSRRSKTAGDETVGDETAAIARGGVLQKFRDGWHWKELAMRTSDGTELVLNEIDIAMGLAWCFTMIGAACCNPYSAVRN